MRIPAYLFLISAALLVMLLPGCGTDQLPDHSKVPGIIITYSPASKGVYLGSPGIAILPGGGYVASLDYFGPSTDMTTNALYRSTDRGETWRKLTEIEGQFWSTLFVHNGALYLLGTSRRYGAVVIRRSKDGGETWTSPADDSSGLLVADSMFHCAPVPVLIHGGRLWKGFERQTGEWPSGFRPFVVSAPVDADLLNAENWTVRQS
ncbi:MAG: sialidase family protein, partial [Bacteroidota bacterium]